MNTVNKTSEIKLLRSTLGSEAKQSNNVRLSTLEINKKVSDEAADPVCENGICQVVWKPKRSAA